MRLRKAPKAPLAVAGILATPLFFVALMAMSLAVEKPSVHHVLTNGKIVARLGDPLGSTERAIWLLALVPPWTTRHTARYPDGIDLIPRSSTSDLYLRGEWEGTARHTAERLGIATIVLAGLALGFLALFAVRRRRHVPAPVPPPPPEVITP